jgi:molybdate transport system substrate-binding protein
MAMTNRLHAFGQSALLLVALLPWPALSFAQLNVIISGGFRAAYLELLPDFERATGIKVNTISGGSQGNGPNTIGAQLRRNVPADAVIMNRAGLDELIAEGRILARTDVDLAETPLAVAVRAGAPKPDISTPEAFKQTLLRVKSLAIDGSTTGIYVTTRLFPRLGIEDVMAKKTSVAPADVVARGEAQIAIRPASELMPVKGIDIVGNVPDELQQVSIFAGAIVADSRQVDASQKLLAFLTSDVALRSIAKSGMRPVSTRSAR